jgi:hypothetical protein
MQVKRSDAHWTDGCFMNKQPDSRAEDEGERASKPTELDERHQTVAEYAEGLRLILKMLRKRLS